MTACQNGCVGGASVAAAYLSHSLIAIVDVHYDVCVVSHNIIGTPLNLRGRGEGERGGGGGGEGGGREGERKKGQLCKIIINSNVQHTKYIDPPRAPPLNEALAVTTLSPLSIGRSAPHSRRLPYVKREVRPEMVVMAP